MLINMGSPAESLGFKEIINEYSFRQYILGDDRTGNCKYMILK